MPKKPIEKLPSPSKPTIPLVTNPTKTSPAMRRFKEKTGEEIERVEGEAWETFDGFRCCYCGKINAYLPLEMEDEFNDDHFGINDQMGGINPSVNIGTSKQTHPRKLIKH